MLAVINVSETQALGHSLEWLTDAIKAVQRDRLQSVALNARVTFSAVQAAQNGEEAFDSFQRMVAVLDDPFEESAETGSEPDDDVKLAELDMLVGTVPIYVEVGHGQG